MVDHKVTCSQLPMLNFIGWEIIVSVINKIRKKVNTFYHK